MRITAPLAMALALGWAGPAGALDLSAGTLRGSDAAARTVPEPVVDPWQAMAALDEGGTRSVDAEDQLDAIVAEDALMPNSTAEAEPLDVPKTVQEAMMALAPLEPAVETIPVLHAAPPAESVSYHVPRASRSLSVLGSGWSLNNPRGSTKTLGSDWGG